MQKNRATSEDLDIAYQFTEREYVSAAEVAKEFSKAKKGAKNPLLILAKAIATNSLLPDRITSHSKLSIYLFKMVK